MTAILVTLRRLGAAGRLALLPIAVLALAACSSDYNLGITPSLGVGMNVALAVSGGVTQIDTGTATTVYATVSNDTHNQGVTWSLLGPGTLTDQTTTTVIYAAPAPGTVTGEVAAQITATSVADPTNNATVTIATLGTPVITTVTPFAAIENVAYEADISAVGGVSPFSWTQVSGTLPPGLTFNGSSTGITSVTGTPTAAGTYPITVEVEDDNSDTYTQTITLVVNPPSTCMITGQFAFSFSGWRGGARATHTGVITIATDGTITGEQDYKDGNRTTLYETLDSSSNCTNRSTNSGVITLNAPSGELVYNFAAMPPDSNNVIQSARLQIIGSPGSSAVFEDSGSGEMDRVDATALTGTPPSGNFAFGLLGVDPQANHYGTAGRFTSSAGTLSAGLIDSNGGSADTLGGPATDAALSGTLSAPDALGRGTLTLQTGAASDTLVYYIVNANRMLLMNANPAVNTAREIGVMTSQTGNVSPGTFDAGALASPAILSLWGALGDIDPFGVVSLGRLANGNASAGTVDLELDTADQSVNTVDAQYPAQSYSVDASGRGVLTLANGSTTRSLVLYLDGTADGYVVEQNSASGNAGLLEAQTVPAGGFSGTLNGYFVGDTQYPQSQGPVSLLPLMTLQYNTLSSDVLTATLAINPDDGRAFGTATEAGEAETADVYYIVSPTKVDLMNFATPYGTDGSILWLQQN